MFDTEHSPIPREKKIRVPGLTFLGYVMGTKHLFFLALPESNIFMPNMRLFLSIGNDLTVYVFVRIFASLHSIMA